jgi:DNA-binding NarL/FixJ family response regulator
MADGVARALVVEDERAWQEILTEILTDIGLAVDVAGNLDDAVACLRSAAHRLAVVDLALTGPDYANQDGLRVLEAVRRYDPGCVPMLLTGYATVELAVSALSQYGAYTCLRKETFRRATFRELLKQALAVAPPAAPDAAAVGEQSASAAPAEPRAAEEETPAALLVEDDAGWRSILLELLGQAGFRARACASYGEALGWLRRGRYVVAVVDLSLASSVAPDGNQDGFQVLAGTQGAGIPTVVVSGTAAPAGAERAYADYGIYAYLEKQGFERTVFLSTVQEAALAGGASAGVVGLLTPREREVLALMVGGLTNKGIASAMVISTNTVKRYLKSIFEKLDVDSRAAATAKAVAAGVQPESHPRPLPCKGRGGR